MTHRAKLITAAALIFSAALGVLPAVGADIQSNIPASRLKDDTYTSPDGTFVLTLPALVTPGAKAEERQISKVTTGVFFTDDFGTVYYVLQTDNSTMHFTLDQVAADYTINDALREKEIITTARGSELRLAGIAPGSSPIVSETKVNGKTTQQKLDLHQAMSVFVAGAYVYEVTAGVTAIHQETDADLSARAKQHLDAFLDGLRVEASASSPRN